MKELIYTLIFAGLGILLIFLLLFMFLPGKEDGESVETKMCIRDSLLLDWENSSLSHKNTL